jgi:hypothetical protein
MNQEEIKALCGDLNTEEGQRILGRIKGLVLHGQTVVDADRVHMTYYHAGRQSVANWLDSVMRMDLMEMERLDAARKEVESLKEVDDFLYGDRS